MMLSAAARAGIAPGAYAAQALLDAAEYRAVTLPEMRRQMMALMQSAAQVSRIGTNLDQAVASLKASGAPRPGSGSRRTPLRAGDPPRRRGRRAGSAGGCGDRRSVTARADPDPRDRRHGTGAPRPAEHRPGPPSSTGPTSPSTGPGRPARPARRRRAPARAAQLDRPPFRGGPVSRSFRDVHRGGRGAPLEESGVDLHRNENPRLAAVWRGQAGAVEPR